MTTAKQQDQSHHRQDLGKFDKFYRFFDLPRELRDLIIEEVCLFPNGVFVHDRDLVVSPIEGPAESLVWQYIRPHRYRIEEYEADDVPVVEAAPPVDLFLAGSDELYRSAMGIYYGRNTFHLNLRGVNAVSHSRSSPRPTMPVSNKVQRLLMSPGNNDGTRARMMIRSVAIYSLRISGREMESFIIPALKEMVLEASLRRLQVNIIKDLNLVNDSQLSRLRRSKGTDPTKAPAFKQLMGLLTDPDLERGTMKVCKGAHSWFWCRFHEQGKTEAQEYSIGMPGDKINISACVSIMKSPPQGRSHLTADDWLEVDVPMLLRACGGDAAELKIVKVDADQGTYW